MLARAASVKISKTCKNSYPHKNVSRQNFIPTRYIEKLEQVARKISLYFCVIIIYVRAIFSPRISGPEISILEIPKTFSAETPDLQR